MMELLTKWTELLLAVLYVMFKLTSGYIEVSPNPALIYENAPPGTPVLTVTAKNDVTLEALDSVSITGVGDSAYFSLHKQLHLPAEWILRVKLPIDKQVGYLFEFTVYTLENTIAKSAQVKINVTEQNIFHPSFEKSTYSFVALRNGFDINLTHVGSVKATDGDKETYNSVFHYHILDPVASAFFYVDLETGDLELIDNIPYRYTNMTFNVTAIDGGSPQLLNSTTVTVTISDVPPPEIFCVAVEDSVARICWKDPTNGSYVMKYELLFQMDGQNATKIPVHVNGIKDETCSIVRGNQLGRNYTFTVRVLNGLEWSPDSLQRKVQIERKGLYGDCPLFSNCSVWEPCKSHGECLVNDDLSYTCNCSKGWGGENCTGRDRCAKSPCKTGTCNFTGDRKYTCDCPPTHYGTKCEKLSACAALPCGKGRCKQKGEGHVCFCPDGTERSNCDDAFCEEDGPFYDKTGRYHWPKTRSGDVARIRCRYGPVIVFHDEEFEFASRDCAVQSTGEPYWKQPDTSGCLELKDDDVSQSLRDLESHTRDASGLRSDEIANITSILEEYFYFSFENQEIAREITMVVGNLLDANETVLVESNSKNHSSERLVGLLDEYVSKVKTDTNITIETENINLQIVNYTQSEDTGYHYLPNLLASREPVKSGVSLRLPPETLSVSGDDDYPRLELTTFRASSFFIPEDDAPTQEVVNKQWVVTAVIHGRHLKNLTEPVEIIIENIENRNNHTCAFWDTENRTWSSEGVVTLNRGDNYTRCMSYHLTSFAILLDPSPEHALSSQHEQILTYISYIGCGISIVGLALTILTYSLFRSLNREKSGKILMNLCSSLLLLNIVFILGSETSLSLSGDAMCKVVAILLHYFLLSTLTWMLVEAINMYQALITVFTKYSGYFMLKRCIFAWGVPAIVVIVTVAIDDNNYRTSTELCFLSQGSQLAFYISLLGPACLILMINIAVFIMVSRVILKPRFTGQVSGSDSLNPAQIRGAFAVMTLLGVTWVFGPFAINEAKVVVNYVFTILNSLQGFLIFVFRCCFNPEVRMAWVLLIKTGKLKRRRGPIKGMYTSETTSSKGDTKLNGSFDDTVKSNVYNSIGKPRNILNNDRNLDTKSQNALPKASKDPYFDDYNKVINDQNNRRVSNTETNGRHRSVDQSVYERNGYNKNGDLRNGDSQGGITTIYTGKNVRRLSGFVPQHDEFTRL